MLTGHLGVECGEQQHPLLRIEDPGRSWAIHGWVDWCNHELLPHYARHYWRQFEGASFGTSR